MRYFETRFLDEADEFIAKLDRKSASKVFYNIDLAEQTNDPRLFKKLQGRFGSLEVNTWVTKTGSWHFGIKLDRKKRLFWQLTDL